ncbi:MAG: glycosyltransferase [Actinomycetota bacterium]
MTVIGWPSVAVVVPTQHRPAELRRAVRSILAQDYPGDLSCVVVFDQAEPFDLSDVALPEGRSLAVTRNARTPGGAGAKNTGVDVSFADLVAFCDDDDEWVAGKVSAQVEALHAGEGAKVVLCGVEFWRDGVRTPAVPTAISISHDDLCRSPTPELHGSTFLVDREAYEVDIGPYDEGCPGGYGQDFEWLLRASKGAPVVMVRDALVRIHREGPSDADERWRVAVDGIPYLLRAHPELRTCRRLLSRLERTMAFGYASLGRGREALPWALRSIRHGPAEPGSYLALVGSIAPVSPAVIDRWATRSVGV